MSVAQDVVEENFAPPTPSRVAQRALSLSAVCCRAFIDADFKEPGAEDLRQRVISWIEAVGISKEMEESEHLLISQPLGTLEQRKGVNASWLSEGLVVLAWALRRTPLPPFHQECEPSGTANLLGFLAPRDETVLSHPALRSLQEIDLWANTYLTIHWRLNDYSLNRTTLDFVDFVERCNWANLDLSELEIIDRELAIQGTPIHQVDQIELRRILSVVSERHRAFNWLLGFEVLYSQVTADT